MNFCCFHPSGYVATCFLQELVSMRARLVELEDEKKRVAEHTVRHNPGLGCLWLFSKQSLCPHCPAG